MGLWRSFGRRGAPLSSSGSLQADAGEEGGFGIVPGIERGGIERGGSEAGWVGFLGLGGRCRRGRLVHGEAHVFAKDCEDLVRGGVRVEGEAGVQAFMIQAGGGRAWRAFAGGGGRGVLLGRG